MPTTSVKEKGPDPRGEDRGRAAKVRRFVDYARMRCRPSVPPEGDAVVIDIVVCIRERSIGEPCLRCGEAARADTKKPGEPPGDRVLAII
jgi:hypothetical protein